MDSLHHSHRDKDLNNYTLMQMNAEMRSCSTPVCISSASSTAPPPLRQTATPPPAAGVRVPPHSDGSDPPPLHGTAPALSPSSLPLSSPGPSVSRSSSSATTIPSLETTSRELRDVQLFLRGNAFDVGGPYADLFMVLLSTVRTLVDAAVLATPNSPPSELSPSSSLSSQRPAVSLQLTSATSSEPVHRMTPHYSGLTNTSALESRVAHLEEALQRLQRENTLVMKALDRVLRIQLEERKKTAPPVIPSDQHQDMPAARGTSASGALSPSAKVSEEDWMTLKHAIDAATERYCRGEYAKNELLLLPKSTALHSGLSSVSSGGRTNSHSVMERVVDSFVSLMQTVSHDKHYDHQEDKHQFSHTLMQKEEMGKNKKKGNLTLSSANAKNTELTNQVSTGSVVKSNASLISGSDTVLQALICRLEVLEAYSPFSLPRMRARLPFLGFEVITNMNRNDSEEMELELPIVDPSGITVRHVYPGYAAAHQGLQPGDMLLSMNDVSLCPSSSSSSGTMVNGAGQLYLVLEEVLREDRARRMATLHTVSSPTSPPPSTSTAENGGVRKGATTRDEKGEGLGSASRSRLGRSSFPQPSPSGADNLGSGAGDDAGLRAVLNSALHAPCVLRFTVQSASERHTNPALHQKSLLWTMQLEVSNSPRG